MIDRYTTPEMQKLWTLTSKFSHWETVELAILEARSRLEKIPLECFRQIRQHAGFTVERIDELEAEFDQDMIAFVQCERETLRKAGVTPTDANKFHEHHTSYDIEDPAFMMMLQKAATLICASLHKLRIALFDKAKECQQAWIIARTHVQFAEPTTFAHLLLEYGSEVGRAIDDIQRVTENELSVGKMSGAVGTYAGLDPREEEIACKILGLKPARVATQIVSRTRHARFMSALTTASGVIETMAYTFEMMMHSCVHELEEPRRKNQRGSSAMPWKKNPILVERLMGMPRVMRGYLIASQENIRVLEFRDISQSSVERIIFPDATTLLHYMAEKAAKLIQGLVIFPDYMTENIERTRGVWAGQRIRYALGESGVDDDVAYLYIQRISFKAVQEKRHLRELLSIEPLSETDPRTGKEVLDTKGIEPLFDVKSYVGEGLQVIYDRFGCM